MTDDGPPPDRPGEPAPDAAEARAALDVLRGLRALAAGRLAGLAIAPGEYLADIYAIQRVATLLAMELAAAGRTVRRTGLEDGTADVQAIDALLGEAFTRRDISPEECVLDLISATVQQRDGSPV